MPEEASELSRGDLVRGHKAGFVSLWVGTFPSVEAAEAYFGIPDEIGVYLPPEAFAADFHLPDFPPESLEVNFEQLSPRPLSALLAEATFSASFIDLALNKASRLGIQEVQGIALLYDHDYRSQQGRVEAAGPLNFIGAFPYVRFSSMVDLRPFRALAHRLHFLPGAVLFVARGLGELTAKRRQERGDDNGHVSARELCDYFLSWRGEDSKGCLRELGLPRSEDIGRVVFGLVGDGVIRRQESDAEEDFQGLFALG